MNLNISSDFITQQANQAPKNKSVVNEEDARKVSDDFESFFLFQMLELMQPDTSSNAYFGGGFGEEMFASIRNEHVADNLVEAGGVGLSDTIYDHLLKLQEVK